MDQQEQPPSLMPIRPQPGRLWLASQLLQRQVVNVSTLEPLGRVADVVFDSERRQIVGISVHLEEPPEENAASFAARIRRALVQKKHRGAIALEHIVALNGDVVMVNADPVRSTAPFENMLYLKEVCELVILTTFGKSLGSLADLLLDARGTLIMGYVVKPTELAASLLPLAEDLAEFETQRTPEAGAKSSKVDRATASSTLASPIANLRVIPASYRIRFGDALILLVTEVEPIQREVVTISPPVRERAEPGNAS